MAEEKPSAEPAKPKLSSSRRFVGRRFASKRAAPAPTATAEAPTTEVPTAAVASPGGEKEPERKAPKPNLDERMEGIQGWMAEIERRQKRMARFGGAAVILAILAAGGAIALGIINQQEAATNDDVDEIKEALAGTQAAVKQATEKQLKILNETVASLDQRLQTLTQQQAQSATTIATLQTQLNTVQAAANAAPPIGAPATPGAPGAQGAKP